MRLEQSKSTYWAYVKAGLVFTAFFLAKTTGFLPDLRPWGREKSLELTVPDPGGNSLTVIMSEQAGPFASLPIISSLTDIQEQPLSPILLDNHAQGVTEQGDEILVDSSVAKATQRRLLQIFYSTTPVPMTSTMTPNPVHLPPQLVEALPNQTAIVDKAFSFEIPLDAFQDPQGEAIQYLASRFNSSVVLPQWLQFDPLNRRFNGTPSVAEVIVVNVTAVNLWLLSITTHFTILVSQSDNSENTPRRNWIIAAVLPETLLILYHCIQIRRRRAAERIWLQAELERNPEAAKSNSIWEQQKTLRMEIVIPVAKEIANLVNITGYCGYNEMTVNSYKYAVRRLLGELEGRRVNLEFSSMQTEHKDALLNTIATQTQRHFVPHQRCYTNCVAFFKAQLDPFKLQKAAPKIAQAIVAALLKLPDGQKTFFLPRDNPDSDFNPDPKYKEKDWGPWFEAYLKEKEEKKRTTEMRTLFESKQDNQTTSLGTESKSSESVSLWLTSDIDQESKVRLSSVAMLGDQNRKKSKEAETQIQDNNSNLTV